MYLSFGLFFSGASAARWWRLECKRLFCLYVDWLIDFFEEREKQCAKCARIAKSVTEKNNSRVDCAEAGKKTVQAQRYEG